MRNKDLFQTPLCHLMYPKVDLLHTSWFCFRRDSELSLLSVQPEELLEKNPHFYLLFYVDGHFNVMSVKHKLNFTNKVC